MADARQAKSSEHKSLQVLDYVETMLVRPYGKEGANSMDTHYTVALNFGDKYSGDISWPITFYVKVNDLASLITVESPDGTILSCTGSLERFEEQVTVTLIESQQPIGIINRNHITDFTITDPERQLIIYVNHDCLPVSNEDSPVLYVIEERDANGLPDYPSLSVKTAANIHSILKFSAVMVNFLNPCMKSTQKALVLIAALKVLHQTYSIHKHPMPVGILHSLPPGKPSYSGLEALNDIPSMLLRTTYRHRNADYVAEFLHETNHTIEFVVQMNDGFRRRVTEGVVYDVYGNELFNFTFQQYSNQTQVYDSNGKIIGECALGKITEARSRTVLKIKKIYGCQNPTLLLADEVSADNKACILMEKFYQIRIDMNIMLRPALKATILAYAVISAKNFYKLWDVSCIPMTNCYRFRSTITEPIGKSPSTKE